MRFRLRTLMIAMAAFCVFCGWCGFLKRMTEFHRSKATGGNPLISEHPGMVLEVYLDGHNVAKPIPGSRSYHSARVRDFEHAVLRPWLAFVHCKPGSIFGAPIQRRPPAPIVKRLAPRDDNSEVGDY